MVKSFSGFDAPLYLIRAAIDIGILTFVLYEAYSIVSRTNGMQIIRAFMAVAAAYGVAFALHLDTMLWILQAIAPAFLVVFAVVFQPEIRKLFLKIGQGQLFMIGARDRRTYIDSVLIAAEELSKLKRGMLCVFTRRVKLDDIIATGTRLDADVSSSLLVTIFVYDTPLHDGACFVQGGKIASAGCFLPLSEQYDIKKTFGTRHRAALGVSEISDAVALVVSEETGAISLAYDSELHYDLTLAETTRILERLLNVSSGQPKAEGGADEAERAV